ncbi:MAG: PilZ domain-containing protein [Desulfosarcinaceae bacterium]
MIKKDNRQNRRKYGRRPAYIIVEYTVREGRFRDILKSVGANGLFVNTTRSINAGQTISLRLPLFSFDEMVELSGQVVRSGPHGFAVELDQPIEAFAGAKGRLPNIVHEIDRN